MVLLKIESTYIDGNGKEVYIYNKDNTYFVGIRDGEDIYYTSMGVCLFWHSRLECMVMSTNNKDDLVKVKVCSRSRPSKLATHMATAEAIAERSHDAETQVGAVLVKMDTETVIAQCYNGFVRGAPDEELPNTRPDKYEYMCHAEQNLITHCARQGISMENTYVVCTHSPCKVCMRMLWNAGVKKVVVKQKYKDFHEILEMRDLKVVEVGETPEGFAELRYEVKV
jgi:dCMP deaminase